MSCTAPRPLVDAYLDGELDLMKSLEMEEHLRECAICSGAHEAGRNLRSSLQLQGLRFAAPADLRRRVRAGLRDEAKRETPAPIPWHWLSLAASFAVVAALVVGALPELGRQGSSQLFIDEIVAGHVRSLMVDHMTDVASTDKHTVKPWFDGKLDFSPAVVDLADHGFPLVGGRLDYLGSRPVAALVYRRQRHLINLFVWASAKEDPREHSLARQGFQVMHWWDRGMSHWAVSDLNAAELAEFAALVRERGG
ncbi:MAG TPA: zf-HC2 domain-containing protein [Candidatus Binatia bacterium]|nr:zf-HC2 domain-containing protein [Candidatus Binatia bacterium]